MSDIFISIRRVLWSITEFQTVSCFPLMPSAGGTPRPRRHLCVGVWQRWTLDREPRAVESANLGAIRGASGQKRAGPSASDRKVANLTDRATARVEQSTETRDLSSALIGHGAVEKNEGDTDTATAAMDGGGEEVVPSGHIDQNSNLSCEAHQMLL